MKNRHRILFARLCPAGSSLLLAASLLVPAHCFATVAAGFETGNPKVEILDGNISIEHFSGASGGIADAGLVNVAEPAATNVPEPATTSLVLGSLLLLASRRRR